MSDFNLFNEIAAAYLSLCWFIWQTLKVIFNNVMPKPLTIVVPILLSAFPYLIKNDWFTNFKKDAPIKRSIALMPAFWVFIGLWGGVFRKRGWNAQPWPDFIAYVVLVALVLFLVYGIYYCIKNKGYRIPTIILFVINIFFALSISFCAGMSITGDWL